MSPLRPSLSTSGQFGNIAAKINHFIFTTWTRRQIIFRNQNWQHGHLKTQISRYCISVTIKHFCVTCMQIFFFLYTYISANLYNWNTAKLLRLDCKIGGGLEMLFCNHKFPDRASEYNHNQFMTLADTFDTFATSVWLILPGACQLHVFCIAFFQI
mgnify:CR=1 FL=1